MTHYSIGPRFKAHGYAIPDEVDALIRGGIAVDLSWDNDLMACAGAEFTDGAILRLWVDYPEPGDREIEGDRYIVDLTTEDGSTVEMISTDHVEDAVRVYRAWIDVETKEPKPGKPCRSFLGRHQTVGI